jgi:hypothetical protein
MPEAQASYAARLEYINAAIDDLKIALSFHAEKAARNSKNWGFTGDLGRVVELLDEAVGIVGQVEI